ncbi:MAG: hypothetical protein KAR19_03755 [Bacteroidales bacterium]|nr:hypothetical protein [Bacteroidales bacterium]
MSLKKDIIEAEFRTTGANKLHHDIGKTEGDIKRLNNENERLRVNKVKLEAQGKKNTKAWKDLNTQIKKNTESVRTEKQRLVELNSKLKVTEMSARQLGKQKRELTRELNNTSKALNPKKWNQLNKELKKVTTQYGKVRSGGRAVNGVMKKMGALLPVVGIAAVVAGLKRMGTEFFNLAKTIKGEAIRASTVFGDELEKVEAVAERLAKKMGLTNREFVANAASTADLLIPLGFARDAAADMALELQSLTGALDEWTAGKLGAEEVSNILTKAMLGENEQLKQLGIAIRKDTDEFRDLVKQKIETTGATKVQAEAMATLELIQRKSADAQSAYTAGGNKLLRTQKEMSVRIKNLKEGFIGLFDVSDSRSLKDQQTQANQLAISLADSNLATEDRIKLLDELQILAPDIVSGLESENLSYENLKKNLKAYNDEMANKIVIASLDEDEQKVLARKAKAQANLNEAKLGLADMIAWYDSVYEKTIGTSEGSLIDKVLGIQAEVGDVYFIKAYLRSYNKALRKVEQETNKGEAFDKRKDNLLRILGIDPEISPEETADEIISSVTSITDKVMKGLLAENERLYQEEMTLLKQHLLMKEITQQDYEDRIIELKIASLEQEKEIRQQAGEGIVDIGNKILDLEIQIMNKKADEADRIRDEQQKKDEEAADRELERITEQMELDAAVLDKRWKSMEAEAKKEAELLDERIKLYEEKVFAYSDFSAEIGNSIGEALASGEEGMKKLLKGTLLTSLKFLRDFARAKIIMMSLASPESIATAGIAGIAKAAALTLLVEIAYATAKSGISKMDTGEKSNYYAGGPTGLGGKYEPAGVVHKNEYVIPEEGLFNPNLRPFINLIEAARQAGNLRSLNMQNVAPRGFVDGGPTTPAIGQHSFSMDPAMLGLLEANIELLKQLRDQGVTAYIGDPQVRDIRNRTKVIEGIERSISR